MNEVVEVLTRVSNGFEGTKKEKAVISDSFSGLVPVNTLLSNHFTEDMKKLAHAYKRLTNDNEQPPKK